MFPLWNSLTPWLVALISLVFLLRKFLTRHTNFWEIQGLPVAKKHALFGTFNVMFLKPLHIEDEENHKTLGNLYGRYDGQTPVLAVTEPEILKDILVKDFNIFPNRRHLQFGNEIVDNSVGMLEDADWKRVRRVLSRTSTANKIRKMIPLIENCIESLKENILEAAKTSQPIDVTRLFNAFVVDIISTCAFGTKLNSHKDPNNPFVGNANVLLCSKWRMYMTVLFPRIMKLFNISLFNPEATNFFKQFVEEVIDRRKKSGEVRSDFVQFIMDAAKETDSDDHKSNVEQNEDPLVLKKKMPPSVPPFAVETKVAAVGHNVVLKCTANLDPPVSYTWSKQGGSLSSHCTPFHNGSWLEINNVTASDAGTYICTASSDAGILEIPTNLVVTGVTELSQIEVVAQCCGFFIAGYSSTSSVLSSVFYNLATHPECQKQLIQEIDRVLGKSQGTIDYNSLSELKYLDAVIHETIRMYPAGLRIERQAVADYTLKKAGIKINKGMIISIPVYALHNDAKWYPEPKRFDPERFSEQEKIKRHPYAYLGFGMGPRACVGMRFAQMTMKLCIIKLLQKFQFKPGAGLAIPPELDSSGALMSIKNVFLNVEERKTDTYSNGV